MSNADDILRRSQDAIEFADYILKNAANLHALGYNERFAETCEGGVSPDGISRRKWRKLAQKQINKALRARQQLRAVADEVRKYIDEQDANVDG